MAEEIYVLWSGGMDSTALILKYLEDGFRVTAGYVEIRNNESKTLYEQRAIGNLKTKIETEFGTQFSYAGVIFEAKVNSLKHTAALQLTQPLFWITSLVYWIDPHNPPQNVSIAYVMNDCAISFLEDFKNIWKALGGLSYNFKQPNLIFPFSKWDKQDIKKILDRHKLFEETVCCENPIGGIIEPKPCTQCHACKRRYDSFFEDAYKPIVVAPIKGKKIEEPKKNRRKK